MTEIKSPRYPLSAEQIAAEYIEHHSGGLARIYVLHPARFAAVGQDREIENPAVTGPITPERKPSAEPPHRLELGNITIVFGRR